MASHADLLSPGVQELITRRGPATFPSRCVSSCIRILPCLVLLAAACACWADSRLSGRYIYPEWYLPYGYSACYPFASCAAYRQYQQLERRRERERELGRPPDVPPAGPKAREGWQGGTYGRIPKSDPANATPGYEEAGRVRPEFERSGEFLPDFLNGRTRP